MNLISLLQEMVKIESVTGNENELCYFLKEILEEFSEVELQKVKDRFNLIAMRGDAEILLLGHLDTVPIGEGWKFKQGEIVDKKLYGRGSSDMKAGLSAMIEAFRVSENVCFAAVVGEEGRGEGAEELNKSMRFKFGIVGEPTDLNLVIVEKGIVTFEVETWGKACHSSRPWDGVNAILSSSIGTFNYASNRDRGRCCPQRDSRQVHCHSESKSDSRG
ncbi:MAG: M20/M25/M40 family metallo-hydrolase [Candidatus Methanofastidiosia archaeon]